MFILLWVWPWKILENQSGAAKPLLPVGMPTKGDKLNPLGFNSPFCRIITRIL